MNKVTGLLLINSVTGDTDMFRDSGRSLFRFYVKRDVTQWQVITNYTCPITRGKTTVFSSEEEKDKVGEDRNTQVQVPQNCMTVQYLSKCT